jgi:hypothetical protein
MKNVRTRALLALMGGAGIPLACSGGGAVNIGNTNVVGSQLSDYAATWDGYAEAYTFMPDGSDRVRLTIAANGQGTLEVGDAALLPPPTDPNVGYPPGAAATGPGQLAPASAGVLTEGFLYPIYAAQVQADRIQLGANPGDLYAAWCALQTTTYPSYDTSFTHPDAGYTSTFPGIVDGGVVTVFYTCLPNSGSMFSSTGGCATLSPDGGSTPVDCGKLSLCTLNMACQCTATGCASNQVAAGTPVSNYQVELDGALDPTGTMLTGTLTLDGQSGTRITVHLTKQ